MGYCGRHIRKRDTATVGEEMIYDCFMFSNELDLLDIRLHELADVVDYFVLVEATKTHSGKDKPLYYWENKTMFSEFSSRILYVCVQDMPMTKAELNATLTEQDWRWIESDYQKEDNWVRERFQRNAMMRVLKDVSPDDIIIIGDADEIVKADLIKEIKYMSHIGFSLHGSNAVEQTLNTYYVNWQCTNMPWWGSKIVTKKILNNIVTPSEVRFHTPAVNYIMDGGWHFGFLGGADAVREKIQSYAHQEFNTVDTLARVGGLLDAKKDALGRLYEYKVIPVDYEHLPKYLVDNQDRFSHLIYKGDDDVS
jgi:beta-1,4-mannosyl-glycoprotein beta-1,4-N-acetylglucosaminyltransferase